MGKNVNLRDILSSDSYEWFRKVALEPHQQLSELFAAYPLMNTHVFMCYMEMRDELGLPQLIDDFFPGYGDETSELKRT